MGVEEVGAVIETGGGGSGAVTSVAGRTGVVVLAESDIANLVSDLAAKLAAANNLSDVANAATARGNLGAAPAASPTFTGTVTLPSGLILPSLGGDVPMNSHKLTGLQAGSAAGHSVRYEQIAVGARSSVVMDALQPLAVEIGLLTQFQAVTAWPTVNKAFGLRFVAPVAGTIDDISFWVHTGNASANYDVAILDDGTTSAGVATKLWSKGSTALTSSGAVWVSNNPNLAVTQGQHFDVAMALSDATTAMIGRGLSSVDAAIEQMPSAYFAAPGGLLPKMMWAATGQVPFGASISEANKLITAIQTASFLVHITPS